MIQRLDCGPSLRFGDSLNSWSHSKSTGLVTLDGLGPKLLANSVSPNKRSTKSMAGVT
jgi:hypothetical protein